MATLVKVDTSKFKKMLEELRKNVPVDAKKVIRQEARLLSAQLAADSIPKDLQKTRKQIKANIDKTVQRSSKGLATMPVTEIYLTRGGKRRKKNERILVQAQAVKAFITQEKSRIGFLGAGWLGGSNPLGAKAKGIVTRQKSFGSVKIIDNPIRFQIIITNLVAYAKDVKGLIYLMQRALNKRRGAMYANLALIKQGVKKYQTK